MTGLDLLQVRAIVTDANVLGRLDPAAVAAYLAGAGWTQVGERPTGGAWVRQVGPERATVFLPNDRTYADFAIRMSELLTTLARVEDRSQLAVLSDLYAAQSGADDGRGREVRP